MGCCFSINSTDNPPATTAKVINPVESSLTEYYLPIKVLHVLGANHPHHFLCNADQLFYGYHIPALEDNHLIELGKLYFMLPSKKLRYAVTGAEMAALAASASSALAGAGLKRAERRRQVVPVVAAELVDGYEEINEESWGSWRRQSVEVKEKMSLRRGRNNGVKMRFSPRLNVVQEVAE